MNKLDVKERRAVVTGAAQGIGRAVGERLVASGARLCIWDRDVETARKTAAEIGGDTCVIEVDQSDWAGVMDAARRTEAEFGPVDILVANAGVAGSNAPVVAYDPGEWRRIIEINLDGVFHCCKALLPGMQARGYGRIVNVASIAGKEGNPNAAAYSASKAGVIALTKALGKETAGQDIAVNCVTPAAARTAIFDQMSEEHIGYMLSKIPRGRFLETTEAAAMIAWLCTAENSFTTGAVFDLSGGRATY
ncbi:SDR family NAD(P)-dependent oxidoreductase [Plastorhodobacter daqingensis]|uniref:SDR family NAD(P)-dependent oxidoreductase n=1 Tax=Plastorhodobacter daqingensis TaxID=1387281 RepID=A0ABW2UL10_9RHOB